jgi:chitinase
MDRLNSGPCRHALSLVVALTFVGLCGTATAQSIVFPLADGGVHTFDQPVTTKYQLFNAPTGITHAGGVMRWSYNDASRPAAISKASVIAQIQASMAKWSAVCRITFVYNGETATGFSSSDGTNVIGWDATNTVISAPTTGITTDAWNGSNTITDADIRLNAAYSATYSPFSNFDATITHEVGHSIGLQHSDVQNQVMSGPPLTSYDGLSALGSDDIAGCAHLYGAAGGGAPPPDTQAPSIPAGLAAAAFSTTQVNLVWNASIDNVGVTNYKVFQGGTQLGTVPGAGAGVSGLSSGTTYSFTVSACDAAGNCSAQSAPASATTLSVDAQAPTVPTGLTATAASSSQVNLAWNASADNVGVTSYKVFQGGTQLGAVTAASAGVTGLAPGTMYSFTVSACDAASNCSAQSASASATTTGASPAPTTQNYQDLWWAGVQENGWGLTITQHQDALFLAWYIYDSSGNPLWVVLPDGRWDAAHTTYTGALYIPSGSWYGDYQVGRFTANASVGNASITFTSISTATLTFSVNGVSTTKAVVREDFGRVDTAPIANYTDLWWGGIAQNGWGVVLTQQYHNIFAAWYTYDASGKTTWLVMPDGAWSGSTYSGALYRTRGTPVVGAVYDASALVVIPAGTLTLTFTDVNTATMTYTVDGFTQTKAITRLPF